MESDSDESFSCTPEEIVKAASTATSNLLPEKSKGQYLKQYDLFMKWRAEKQKNSKENSFDQKWFEEKKKRRTEISQIQAQRTNDKTTSLRTLENRRATDKDKRILDLDSTYAEKVFEKSNT
ncbi:hypothetical protein ILUMI_02251 [Ignelater luminosus]|uniref:Uncharacterized protein n=1 Tax=Ignelater luminosus TaxID=2038154 RepID=A0A8K0DDS8_IGNLU|nr:hypothetical protein ILUMI_02251 [Ignelater luminosus]